MAGTKISALAEMAEAPADLDEFVIVDKSDTTMFASGTNKRLTASNALRNYLPKVQTFRVVTTATDTLVPADLDNIVRSTGAAACTITVPPAASAAWIVGRSIRVRGAGAGIVTIAQGAGVIVNATPSKVFRAQHSECVLTYVGGNVWDASGDFAGAFAPTDIAGLTGWWDGADTATITASAGAVSQWNDKSASANHATQATASLQPATGTRTLNAKNVIEFDGTRGLVISPVSWGSGAARTWFVVLSKDAVIEKTVVLGSTASENVFLAVTNGAASGGVRARLVDGLEAVSGTALTTTAYGIALAHHDGTTAAANLRISLNAGAFGTADTAASAQALDRIGIYPTTPRFSFDGAIAELITYNTKLGNADLNSVGNYLADKWALTWAGL